MRNPICDGCGKVGSLSEIDTINIEFQMAYADNYKISKDMCKECQARIRTDIIATIEIAFPDFIKYIPKAEKPC